MVDIPGWFAPEEADAIVAALPEMGLLVEIGTWKGRSTAMFAERRPLAKILTIDSYPDGSQAVVAAGETAGNPEAEAAKNLSPYPNVTRIVGDSILVEETVSVLTTIDVLFIDGDHNAERIAREVSAWQSHVDGWIFFHDGKNAGQWTEQVVKGSKTLEPLGWYRVPAAEAGSLLAYRRIGDD